MSTPPCLDFRNTNALWCSVIVETLVRCGVDLAVVSPGSRSTPLTMALAAHPGIEAVPVLDERSAAFFALGASKRSHRPTVLVCTSGTAAANYLPAIIEAYESGTPLLVITADRPPELRDCASGQTIDQLKLFGSHVVFFHEFAVAEATIEMLRYARQTMAHAIANALGPRPGPVHLNAPFRDPLPPIEDGSASALVGAVDESFFAHLQPPVRARTGFATAWNRPTAARGFIVAGPVNPADPVAYVAAVRRLAAGLGWPVLADALSPLRHFTDDQDAVVIAGYDAILRSESAARDLAPRQVICLEGWPTSKVLRSWLQSCDAEILLVAETDRNRDALHGRTRHLPVGVEALVVDGEPVGEAGYWQAWLAAEQAVADETERQFGAMDDLFEPKITWTLARRLPAGTSVFVASSMPVRDVEWFWPASGAGHRMQFNRGANGIDGTLSTALGVAHRGGAAVLLTGDLALLHDANGLLLHRRLRGSLTVVLVNNNGGGIFGHLPVAQFESSFEEFFATPQQVDFAALCAAHGVSHRVIADWSALEEAVSDLPGAGLRVLEVRTDRRADVGRRKTLFKALRENVSRVLS